MWCPVSTKSELFFVAKMERCKQSAEIDEVVIHEHANLAYAFTSVNGTVHFAVIPFLLHSRNTNWLTSIGLFVEGIYKWRRIKRHTNTHTQIESPPTLKTKTINKCLKRDFELSCIISSHVPLLPHSLRKRKMICTVYTYCSGSDGEKKSFLPVLVRCYMRLLGITFAIRLNRCWSILLHANN